MFDTMTFTKILGAGCGALLIFLLGGWAAESLYHTGPTGHGDHGEEHASGYEIEVADTSAPVEEGPDFATLLAAADTDKGSKVFNKCKACHKLEDGANSTGPHLYSIIDRPKAEAGDFNFSGALAGLGGTWTPEELNEFLLSPKAFAPGTAMSFTGLKKDTDRANLIAFLAAQGS